MTKRMTCVFDFDLLSLKSNPFHADTPFGHPVIISDGDLAGEYDELEAKIEGLETVKLERLTELLTHAWNGGEVQTCEACGQWFRLEETHSMEEGGWICKGCAGSADSLKDTGAG